MLRSVPGSDDFGETIEVAPTTLPVVCMAELDGKEIPPREWIIDGWIPAHAVTLLAGGGATGKSLLAQQLCVCVALGVPFLGLPIAAVMPTLFINCEDEELELARRNRDIASSLNERVGSLADVYTLSRAGELGNDLGTFDDKRNFQLSALFHAIEATALQRQARLIALDNVAHLFTGNENIRGEVTQFINSLVRLAIHINGAIVLLGHPAKVADSQFSGSTAWENSVRARLFLSRPDKAEGQVPDPDVRILTSGKANYAPKDQSITMRWSKGAFVLPTEDGDELIAAPGSDAGKHNAVFLKCLAAAADEQRAMSHKPNSGSYAPRTFSQMPQGKGVSKHDFTLAMERLLALKTIAVDQKLWTGTNRHPVYGIARIGS